jgi:hypothetical protein
MMSLVVDGGGGGPLTGPFNWWFDATNGGIRGWDGQADLLRAKMSRGQTEALKDLLQQYRGSKR